MVSFDRNAPRKCTLSGWHLYGAANIFSNTAPIYLVFTGDDHYASIHVPYHVWTFSIFFSRIGGRRFGPDFTQI